LTTYRPAPTGGATCTYAKAYIFPGMVKMNLKNTFGQLPNVESNFGTVTDGLLTYFII
jgi:hypothetical protein